MTPLSCWLRNLLERWAGTYYEGPEPPPRLRQQAELFSRMNPVATAEEWVLAAAHMAEESYRSGYARGWERSCRDREWRRDAVDAVDEAERVREGWGYPDDVVPSDSACDDAAFRRGGAMGPSR